MKDLRREYASRTLDEGEADPDPIAQFRAWFAEASAADILDVNAMTLATASASGEPALRTVLLKDVDERGFTFFTHYDGPKGRDLASNPRAGLLFFWPPLERQVRITGAVTRVSRAESESYFASRPIDSQCAAWAARQSDVLANRSALETAYAAVKERFAGASVPCPPNWGGFRVAPEQLEFWQGRPGRLHDRILYTRLGDGTWARTRLAP
jgi:pyridoxamine 5'-phosphate oxidase